MAHKDEPLPLARVQLAQELLEDYRELLPDMAPDAVRAKPQRRQDDHDRAITRPPVRMVGGQL